MGKKPRRPEYERPNQPFHCGRTSLWKKPCPHGPKPDGTCGGVSECAPFKEGDRFVCRRPDGAGGPCKEGPRPDGACSLTHLPCVPRATLRRWRGRLVFLAAAFTVAGLVALAPFDMMVSHPLNRIDPGPLSGQHANFIGDEGCVLCHVPHNKGVAQWLKAAFQSHDMTTECLVCHTFDGPGRKAHNQTFPNRPKLGDTSCVSCHTEHQGREFAITEMPDAHCNRCHQISIQSFAKGHPPFGAHYPHTEPPSIKFNHSSHLGQYFSDPKYGDQAPTCISCHAAGRNDSAVRIRDFDKTCASCHAPSIKQNLFVFLRLPEGGAGQNISIDDATPFMAWLLEDPANESAYGKRVQKIMPALAKSGIDPLGEAIAYRIGAPLDRKLLASLNPEVISTAFEQGTSHKNDVVVIKEPVHGWYWRNDNGEELVYKPTGHADITLKAWIEFAVEHLNPASSEDPNERTQEFQRELLSPKSGPGLCIKCHAIREFDSPDGKRTRRVEWRYSPTNSRPHTRFSHGTHLHLMACVSCHKFDEKADFASQFAASKTSSPRVSNFHAIQRETCLPCHGGGQVRQDCQLCHRYHLEPSFKKQPWIQTREKAPGKTPAP